MAARAGNEPVRESRCYRLTPARPPGAERPVWPQRGVGSRCAHRALGRVRGDRGTARACGTSARRRSSRIATPLGATPRRRSAPRPNHADVGWGRAQDTSARMPYSPTSNGLRSTVVGIHSNRNPCERFGAASLVRPRCHDVGIMWRSGRGKCHQCIYSQNSTFEFAFFC